MAAWIKTEESGGSMLSSSGNANKTVVSEYPQAAQYQSEGLLMPSAGYTWIKNGIDTNKTPMSVHTVVSVLVRRKKNKKQNETS